MVSGSSEERTQFRLVPDVLARIAIAWSNNSVTEILWKPAPEHSQAQYAVENGVNLVW